jgi:serpin B
VTSVAAADADFAFRLYRELTADNSDSLFFSPYSISTALSMTLAGARAKTADELRAALGVAVEDAAWHDARNRLELALGSAVGRTRPYQGEAEPLTLEATNAIFGLAGYAFRDEFLDLLAADYGAGMQATDFVGDSEGARAAINAWVAERTRDRILELLKEGSIDSLTRAVLVNAIFFKANWVGEFSPEGTRPEPFRLLDGSTREVQMMHGSPRTGYATGDGWAAVRLPYWGSASMVVIVPDAGRFADIEQQVDATFLHDLELGDAQVTLSLPRWESESTIDLIPVLHTLGVIEVFDQNRADLSGVADFSQTNEPLYVSGVIHQANITVDEEGTEAAAATAVVISAESGTRAVSLTVDRPFIYVIQDDITGEILFLGRLLKP